MTGINEQQPMLNPKLVSKAKRITSIIDQTRIERMILYD